MFGFIEYMGIIKILMGALVTVGSIAYCNIDQEINSRNLSDGFIPQISAKYSTGNNWMLPVFIEAKDEEPTRGLAYIYFKEGEKTITTIKATGNSFPKYEQFRVSGSGSHKYFLIAEDMDGKKSVPYELRVKISEEGIVTPESEYVNHETKSLEDKINPKIIKFDIRKNSDDPTKVSIEYSVIDNAGISFVNFYFLDKSIPARISTKPNGVFEIRHNRGTVRYILEAVDTSGNTIRRSELVAAGQ